MCLKYHYRDFLQSRDNPKGNNLCPLIWKVQAYVCQYVDKMGRGYSAVAHIYWAQKDMGCLEW